jgi:hypothetical protein
MSDEVNGSAKLVAESAADSSEERQPTPQASGEGTTVLDEAAIATPQGETIPIVRTSITCHKIIN